MIDQTRAARVERFFEGYLHLSTAEWAGRPFVLMPWQKDIIQKIFGQIREDGLRLIRQLFLEIPKKNGKTEFAAGLGLYGLVADREPTPEVYIAALNAKQAGLIFKAATRMVQLNPELSSKLEINRTTQRIVYRRRGGFLQVLSGDFESAQGIHASMVIIDELHTQKNRLLYDTLKTSQIGRKQPLFIMITTAGYDPHSLWGEEHDYAVSVRDGIDPNPEYLPVMFGADSQKDDWTKPETWRKANPSYAYLGPTFQKGLEEEYDRARRSPGFQSAFKRWHLNMPTAQDDPYIDLDLWDEGNQIVDRVKLKGAISYWALDMAYTTDMAALIGVFPPAGGDSDDIKPRQVLAYFWVPEKKIQEMERTSRVPIGRWVAEGFIKATPGDAIDYSAVMQEVMKLREEFDMQWLLYDPNGMMPMAQWLVDEGINAVSMRQGFTLSPAMVELNRLLIGRRVHHGGNPVLRWHMANLRARQSPQGMVRPERLSRYKKIDGAVALIMAVDGELRNRQGPSAYDERGIISI